MKKWADDAAKKENEPEENPPKYGFYKDRAYINLVCDFCLRDEDECADNALTCEGNYIRESDGNVYMCDDCCDERCEPEPRNGLELIADYYADNE
jgi:hypothetical protein